MAWMLSCYDGVFKQCTTTYFGFYASELNHQQHTAFPAILLVYFSHSSSLLHQNLNLYFKKHSSTYLKKHSR